MTDYYDKYLKYKQKYQNLLHQVAGEKYIISLKDLYPVPVHDSSFSKTYDGHKTTYGELTYESIEEISKKFVNTEQFLDVGSGRGKLCLYMAYKQHISKSIGVELVEERYNDAIQLHQQLSTDFNAITDKIHFFNSNIFELKLDDKLDKKTLVYFSNLCFERATSNRIILKLIDELVTGSIIICSQEFDQENDNLVRLENILVRQSWSDNSIVYCYEINK